MARHKSTSGVEKARNKKSKSRTVVDVSSSDSSSDSSSSDSDVSEKQVKQVNDGIKGKTAPTINPETTKNAKKAKVPKDTPVEEDPDVSMEDADPGADSSPAPVRKSAAKPTASAAKSKPATQEAEDFASIYLRKVTAELGDDLDKVREAKDFKSSSLPMLVHALKQGGSMYSVEEKRRVIGTASS